MGDRLAHRPRRYRSRHLAAAAWHRRSGVARKAPSATSRYARSDPPRRRAAAWSAV